MQKLIEASQAVVQHPWTQSAWKWIVAIHHDLMPWAGWIMAAMVVILGHLWLWRALRLTWRVLRQKISSWFGQRKAVADAQESQIDYPDHGDAFALNHLLATLRRPK